MALIGHITEGILTDLITGLTAGIMGGTTAGTAGTGLRRTVTRDIVRADSGVMV